MHFANKNGGSAHRGIRKLLYLIFGCRRFMTLSFMSCNSFSVIRTIIGITQEFYLLIGQLLCSRVKRIAFLTIFLLLFFQTHPTQSCFLSSIDLHNHYSYQVMFVDWIPQYHYCLFSATLPF